MEISCRVVMAPTNGADSGNQSKPVHEENKNENCGKKPKSLSHELTADDVFQEIVQTLNQPLPKILNPAGDRLNSPRCDLCKNYDARGNHPGDKHRVCDSEATELN